MKISTKDLHMKDRVLHKDLKIKKKIEEKELLELIMDSICSKNGIFISKEKIESRTKDEFKLFTESMKKLEVRSLKE